MVKVFAMYATTKQTHKAFYFESKTQTKCKQTKNSMATLVTLSKRLYKSFTLGSMSSQRDMARTCTIWAICIRLWRVMWLMGMSDVIPYGSGSQMAGQMNSANTRSAHAARTYMEGRHWHQAHKF